MEKYVYQDVQLFLEGDIWIDGQKEIELRNSGGGAVVEALISRYRHVGDDFLKAVKGGFRLTLWDRDKQKLIVAVDPFATKPIYYLVQNGRFAFGPGVSCISRVPGFDREVDPNVLYFYLNHSFVPAPHSIYRKIRRLEPGQYIVWHKENLSIRQYWDIQYNEDQRLSADIASDLVYAGVDRALQFYVASQSCTETEMGAFLSGGTDSSTLVGLLSKIQNKPVNAFSVGFDEQAYNEIHYARVAAKHYGAVAHECFVSPEDALKALPVLAESFDEPFGNSSAIPTYFCLRMAKEAGVKVMFAGDGGDELFAGNERYLSEKVFLPFDLLPAGAQALSKRVARCLPALYPLGKIRRYIERASEPNPDRFFYYQLFLSRNEGALFTADFMAQVDQAFPLAVPRRHYSNVQSAAALNRLLYLDLKMCIADNDLFKVNRMAESIDIKVCFPYLDRNLAELTGKIPVSLKLKGSEKRYIFKKAFGKLLPEEILKKKKHGFGLPIVGWLRNHSGFKDLARALLLDNSSLQRGYFQRPAMEALFARQEQEAGNLYSSAIWNLMMLELWHQNHFDRLVNPHLGITFASQYGV